MSLGKCRKCGKIASSEAKTCPHCQARRPVRVAIPTHPPPRVQQRRRSRLPLGIAGGVALAAITLAAFVFDSRQESRAIARAAPPQRATVVQTPVSSHRYTVTAAIARTVKNSVPDPEALVWDRMLANDNASVVCLSYRVRIGADDYAPGYLSYVNGKASETLQDWNIHCASSHLNDMQLVKEAVR